MKNTAEDKPRFGHDKLDVYRVAREALVEGDAIVRGFPRGYGTLADQLRRALVSMVLGIAEAASRSGADRLARFRCARGECSEAGAALEAAGLLGLASEAKIEVVVGLLGRVYAMLTRLSRAGQ